MDTEQTIVLSQAWIVVLFREISTKGFRGVSFHRAVVHCFVWAVELAEMPPNRSSDSENRKGVNNRTDPDYRATIRDESQLNWR